MGKKIRYLGRYVMDDVSLGKGNFARVELATHDMTHIKVRVARIQHGASAYFLCQRVVSINSFFGCYVRWMQRMRFRVIAIAFYGTFKCTFVEEGTSQLVVADATDRCYDSEQLFMNHGHVCYPA